MLKNLSNTLSFAISGILFAIRYERNMKIHVILASVVIILGIFLSISTLEWMIITLLISLVVGFELLNTAIETFCDFLHPSRHPSIKIVKDVSAGAVLMISIAAAACGLIIFTPKILLFL